MSGCYAVDMSTAKEKKSKPLSFPVCYFMGECEFKSRVKVGRNKTLMVYCKLQDTCNQQQHLLYDIEA